MIPRILSNFNLIVAGQGFAGLCDEIELPTLKPKLEQHRGGGMDAPLGMDVGMEEITCSFTMAEHNPVVLQTFGLVSGAAVDLSFRGAMMDGITVTALQVDVTGVYSEQSLGTMKAGEKALLKSSVQCRFYRLTVAGGVLHEVDIVNMTRVINGVDQLAEMRAALMI